MNALNMSLENFKHKIRSENNISIVGITCLTPFSSYVNRIADIAKEIMPDVKVVVGGAHATALPTEILRNNNIDFVIRGEGETTLLELSQRILGLNSLDFEKIKGICFRNNGIVRTEVRPYIEDLDALPFPARHLLPMERYHALHLKGKKVTNILGSRGCPYNCIFCDYRYLMGPKIRYRSPPNIVKEISECIQRYGIDYVDFSDSTFTIGERRVIHFCELLRKESLDISWDCNGRVNLVTRNMLIGMKKSGCKLIKYGVESGNQGILDYSNKQVTLDQIRRAIHLTKSVGIETVAYFILGLPGENWTTIRETINLAKELDPDYAQFSFATPYPGTPLFDYATTEDLIDTKDWDDYFIIDKPIMHTKELSGDDLAKGLKIAYKEFYLRPKYILKKIKNPHSVQELKNNFNGAKALLTTVFK
jgi:radical SAM superfamily enzyme YgiQ (UPF0313 family)